MSELFLMNCSKIVFVEIYQVFPIIDKIYIFPKIVKKNQKKKLNKYLSRENYTCKKNYIRERQISR